MSDFNEPLDQPPLEKSYGILGNNFKIFLAYTIFCSALGGGIGMFISSGIACCHAVLLFLGGLITLFDKETGDKGASMILTSFLLGGIGFSFCFGTLGGIL